MRYFFSIAFFLLLANGYGQTLPTDTTAAAISKIKKADTTTSNFRPTGIRIGTDLIQIVKTIAQDDYSGFLVTADIDFHRYFLVLEYGQLDRSRSGPLGDYEVDGSYWRVGGDLNFFKDDPDNSVLSIGLRYGRSRFSDRITTLLNDPIYGDINFVSGNDDLSGDWFEVVAGLKVKVWKFWLGYNARLKFGIDDYQDQDFFPYEVPGFGLAAERSYWEFNYYLMYRIEWTKK